MPVNETKLPPRTAPRGRRRWLRLAPWLLAAAVFLLGLGGLGQYASYHFDEHYYHDAALLMLKTGDWITPRWADGSPRLNKPFLTYWLVAGGMTAAGTGLTGGRLAVFICGCLMVGFTGVLALRTLGNRHIAAAASALMAGNLLLQSTGARAIPDTPLSLGILVAAIGFFSLPRPGIAAPAMFWMGSGLAFAAKGLLAAVHAAFLLVFGGRRRRLLFSLTILPGIGSVLWWYWLVRSGNPFASFAADQLHERGGVSFVGVLGSLGKHLADHLRAFLPLSPLFCWLGWRYRRRIAAAWRQRRAILNLLLAWVVLVTVLFACGILHRDRYLLPAQPALAVLFAWLLWQVRDWGGWPGAVKVLRRLLGFAGGILVLLIPALYFSGAGVSHLKEPLLLVGLILCLAAGLAGWFGRPGLPALLLLWLAVVNGHRLVLPPALHRDPAAAIASEVPEGPLPSVHLQTEVATWIRLRSGGAVWPVPLTDSRESPAFILAGENVPADLAAGYVWREVGRRERWVVRARTGTGEKRLGPYAVKATVYYLGRRVAPTAGPGPPGPATFTER